jgi:outer membrane protein assembly factor BamB
VIAAIALAACGDTAAEDATGDSRRGAKTGGEWPMFRGNSSSTGVATSELPDQPALLWSFQSGGDIESTAAIADGKVFVGALDGVLYALDLSTGQVVWQFDTGAEIKSSPSVRDGVVYFGDEAGFFHALDAKTGTTKWKFETMAGIISGANFFGDNLVFGSYDNSLYAVRRADGTQLWRVETDGYVHGTPAITGDFTTVSGCDGYLWLVRLTDGSVETKIELGGQAGSSPAIVDNHAFLGTYENEVLAIDLDARSVLWRYEHPVRKFPFYASPAVYEDVVVIGGRDKIVHALDAKTGQAKWTYAAGSRIDSSAVIVGQRAFLATTGGEVLALDLASGERVWTFESGSSFTASPAVAQAKLVISSLDGMVYAFGDGPAQDTKQPRQQQPGEQG